MFADPTIPAEWRFRWFAGAAAFAANSCVTAGFVLAILAIVTDISLDFALAVAGYGLVAMLVFHLVDSIGFRLLSSH